MPTKQFDTPYEVIDADPYFGRVVRYMRPSDYAAWGAATVAFPGSIYLMELFDSTRPRRGLGSALRLGTFLGAAGGFLFAYQRSSFRLWGWRENELEVKRASSPEESDAAKGVDTSASSLDPYMRGVAHRNSAFSQLKFSTLPFFNLVQHEYHGEGTQASGSSDKKEEKDE